MQQHTFGRLPPVSRLTLGGGGLGMVWGETTTAECVATVHAAVAAGINLIDLAPRYGDGTAERVVSPDGVRVAVCVVPTDEERAIAGEVAALLDS